MNVRHVAILVSLGMIPCLGLEVSNKQGQSFEGTVIEILPTRPTGPSVKVQRTSDGKHFEIPLSQLSEETLIALLVDQSVSNQTPPTEIEAGFSYYRSYGLRRSELPPRFPFQEGNEGLHGFFTDLLAEGPREILANEAQKLLKAFFNLQFLPIEKVVKMNIGDGTMDITFDFDGEKEKAFRMPKGKIWILSEEVFEGKRKGSPKPKTIGGEIIILKNTLHLKINAKGIVGVREGDMQGKKLFFKGNLKIKTLRLPKKILKHEGDLVLMENEDNTPLQRNGIYVPQRFDEWLIVQKPSGEIIEVPIPSL